ncbi:hypothetical protein DYB30_002079 [Aphanomyces astaci]|uniref:PAP-associated domain-containing protein n=1 Tax=Aphanomyces astaci TaxID=112090 RepID=A0A397DAL1_APHAT|nr:hypothetical protein DYB38_008210 [Aphanomyces astaci]RHY60902.1 hypothetical protein DYB30_002079 [Aphanomyces astaci]
MDERSESVRDVPDVHAWLLVENFTISRKLLTHCLNTSDVIFPASHAHVKFYAKADPVLVALKNVDNALQKRSNHVMGLALYDDIRTTHTKQVAALDKVLTSQSKASGDKPSKLKAKALAIVYAQYFVDAYERFVLALDALKDTPAPPDSNATELAAAAQELKHLMSQDGQRKKKLHRLTYVLQTLNGHDVTFCTDFIACRASFPVANVDLSVGDLIVRFFDYMATFPWLTKVVSIRINDMTKSERWGGAAKTWRMSIEDPFESTRDLGIVLQPLGQDSIGTM